MMGIELFNFSFIEDFAPRFILNEIVVFIISKQIYFKITQNRDYLFTMVIFNLAVFIVCYLLNSVSLSIGFAFGLFAIFSILRYRTETVPIKEMTYLFIAICVAIINALSNPKIGFINIVIINAIITLFALVLEKAWIKNELSKNITYEKIEMIKPENRTALLEDLKKRTGLNIHRFEIGRINFLQDTANVKIFYYDDGLEQ